MAKSFLSFYYEQNALENMKKKIFEGGGWLPKN